MEAYLADRKAQLGLEGNLVAFAYCVFEKEEIQLATIQLDDLEPVTLKLDDSKAKVQDPLQKVNLRDKTEHKPTFVSQLLEPEFQAKLIELLREYRDCFVWDYDEMPGLSRELVEY